MSTVFYGFMASDEEDLQRQVKLAKDIVSGFPKFFYREGIEFQVFNTKKGLVYRICENGWGIKNKFFKDKSIKKCCYDDRGGYKKNCGKRLVTEIDVCITNKNYRMIIIIEPAPAIDTGAETR